jgi:5-methylcytosine-specific restriction enzyme subunit McrC
MYPVVLALPLIWIRYGKNILVCLKAAKKQRFKYWVHGQKSKNILNGIRPDIVIEKGRETYIIDTKWKNIKANSTDDLRQMYVQWLLKSSKAMLLYPSTFTKEDFIPLIK